MAETFIPTALTLPHQYPVLTAAVVLSCLKTLAHNLGSVLTPWKLPRLRLWDPI